MGGRLRSINARSPLSFPDDLDVCALFAEAMMTRTPSQLWDLELGEAAQGADTLETVSVLERALQLMDEGGRVPHPGVLHMYIHSVEMSPHPERALGACDALRDLAPDGIGLGEFYAHFLGRSAASGHRRFKSTLRFEPGRGDRI